MPAATAPPKVARFDPPQLRAGGSLSVQLAAPANGKQLTYQFRVLPGKEWRTAPVGRVRLTDLKPGLLVMEMRTVGPEGNASQTLTQTWTVLPAPSPPPRTAADLPVRPLAEFWQEVVITRTSRFGVLGTDVTQQVQYTLLSRVSVEKKEPDGTLSVRQQVEAVHLDRADKELEKRLNERLQKMRGATFRLKLCADGKVRSFAGDTGAADVIADNGLPGVTSYRLSSVLDADGWKELAEVTFFRPREPVHKRDRWSRPLTHNWGPLGSWAGQRVFAHTAHQAGLDRYDYVLDLAYHPPEVRGGGLPFRVAQADFRIQSAAGAIAYDPRRARPTQAHEVFHVRGMLTVSALGVDTAVEVEEQQLFHLQLHDHRPPPK
jgi:hypothetical protein